MRKSTYFKKMNSFGKVVVDKVATVISTPSVIKSNMSARRANADADVMLEAKKYKGMPDNDGSGKITDAFKVRSVAQGVKDRMMKRKK